MMITTIGDNCVDIYDRNKLYAGGNALNTAIALSRTGLRSAYLGAVGSDMNGRFITDRLIAEGVDITGLKVIPGSTGWTRISIREAQRYFLSDDPGVQVLYHLTPRDHWILEKSRVIHCTGFTNWSSRTRSAFDDHHGYVLDQLAAASSSGAEVSMDFSAATDEDLCIAAGGLVDIAFCSAEHMDEEQLAVMLERLSRIFPLTVITCGAQGSIAADARSIWRQDPVSVHPCDTLGAGDAFIGAFLSSWARHRDVPTALQDGARYAALVCSREGPC